MLELKRHLGDVRCKAGSSHEQVIKAIYMITVGTCKYDQ